MKQVEKWYLPIDGKQVETTKEIYIAYRNLEAKERMQKIRRTRCMIPNGKGGLRLCPKTSCRDCPHHRTGTPVSLDYLKEDFNFDVEDPNEDVIAEVNKEEQATAVRNAIMELDEIDRRIITMIFYEDMSEGEVAKKLCVSQSAIHQRKANSFKILQEKLKNFQN